MASDYICVRVININRVNLNAFPFDFDLTMAIVLANADGTVYHRYGGREHLAPMHMETLVDIMRKGMATHQEYEKNPAPPSPRPPQFLPELVNGRLKGLMQPVTGCFHCHYAREARQLLKLQAGAWTPDQFWIFPLPERLGLVMDQRVQYRVSKVMPGSAAAAEGIEPGDVLESLGGRRMLTNYDIQWVLDQCPGEAIPLPYVMRREGERRTGQFALEAGWKTGDPDDYAWRVENPFTAHMIKFLPSPGLLGDRLSAAELEALGFSGDRFAMRVTRLNFGPHQAGIRLGDTVLSAGGRSDFKDTRDFHAWCEAMRRSGRDIKLEVWREGHEMAMMVSLSHLNFDRVESAPRVDVGFILQQLPAAGGLRVGKVTEGGNAERAGLRTGDRVVAIDAEVVVDGDRFLTLLLQKVPGDPLVLDLVRDGMPLQLSYVLAGEGEVEREVGDLARLSGTVAARGQELTCTVMFALAPGKHIYSANLRGFGLPTRVNFRGRGYRLIGGLAEPPPVAIGEGPTQMWILEGDVALRQRIEVTDPDAFEILLEVSAQVCDEVHCDAFRAVLRNDGSTEAFSEFGGPLDQQPTIPHPPR